jgi:hypothetical protein
MDVVVEGSDRILAQYPASGPATVSDGPSGADRTDLETATTGPTAAALRGAR